MKKLISLLLVICILCPVLIGCVNQDQDAEESMEQRYLRQFNIEGKEPEDVIIDYDGGTYNGARIVMLDAEMNKPVIWSETIAEVTIQYYDTNRLYAYKSEKFYTLAEAYANYILYSKDIVSIAEKFNKEVTHFTDTCDKYDFPKGKILELEGSDKEWISCHSYEYIYIYLDIAVYGTGSKDLIEYLGSDSITDIGFIELRVNHKEFPDYYPMLLCAVLKEQTKECADCAMEEIVQIPGVIGVSYFHPVGFPAEATNNATHSSNEYWWLDEIQVEKVWDFTTGSFLSLKNKF